MIALNLANHSLSFSTCTFDGDADEVFEVLLLGRIGRVVDEVGRRRQARHDAREAETVEPDLLRILGQRVVDVLLRPVEVVLRQALRDPQAVRVELRALLRHDPVDVDAVLLGLAGIGRDGAGGVDLAVLEPGGEIRVLAEKRLLLLHLGDEIPGRLHVGRNVLELAAAGDLRREVEADAVIVEGDAALELRVEQVLPRLRRARPGRPPADRRAHRHSRRC